MKKYQKGGGVTKKKACPEGTRRNSNGRCTPVVYTSSGEYKYTKKDGGKCKGVRCKERPEGLVGYADNEKKVKIFKLKTNINKTVNRVKSKMVKGGSLRRSIKH